MKPHQSPLDRTTLSPTPGLGPRRWLVMLLALSGFSHAQQVPLSTIPATVSTQVEPNIVVTLDDSGSMAWTKMGDSPPYATVDQGFAHGPWRCAAVVDASAPPFLADGVTPNPAAMAMNGVYYNPNITYAPPIDENGVEFPQADASLTAVPVDGIAVHRSRNRVTLQAPDRHGNPDVNGLASDDGATDILNGRDSNNNSWNCGTGDPSSTTALSDDWYDSSPPGGPYYFRYVGPALTTDTAGNPDATSLSNLYTSAIVNPSTGIQPEDRWTRVRVPREQYQNFANWYAYYRTRSLMARTALSRIFAKIGSPVRVAWQNLGFNNVNNVLYTLPANTEIHTLDNNSTDPLSGEPYRKAFFDWIFENPAHNGTPTREATIRVGNFFKRGPIDNTDKNAPVVTVKNGTNPYWQPPAPGQTEGSEPACRQNYHLLLTDGYYNGDTPDTGLYLQTAAAINAGVGNNGLSTHGGLQTYTPGTTLSPTGIYNGDDSAHGATVNDKDNHPQDVRYATMANIAFHYWASNLRQDLTPLSAPAPVPQHFPDTTTGVTAASGPADGSNPEVFWNPANDPATWPHLVQYVVTLGAFGSLHYSDDIDCKQGSPRGNNDLCKLRKSLITWPAPNSEGTGVRQNIDDLWHAAINSRGAFFVATDPQILITRLQAVINNIAARSSSSSAISSSVGVLGPSGALSYRIGFQTDDWSGQLNAYTIDGNANIASLPAWQASFPDVPDRQILTATDAGTGKGVAFRRLADLSAAEQTILKTDLGSDPATSDDNGQLRLDYLRGDRSHEAAGSVPAFHPRSTVLGAIVNSQPMYVAYPDSGYIDDFPAGSAEKLAAARLHTDAVTHISYEDPSDVDGTTYEQFVKNHRQRKPTLYVGANDGMLHAFGASDGKEMFAYIPQTVFANLDRLTLRDNFSYTNFVDNSPIHRDVFDADGDKKWHTLLLGTLRLGGRGVFALDITDPTKIGESSAASTALWEFNNSATGGANLGYTFGLPNVARTRAGWVVIVPSGDLPQCPGTPLIANCSTDSRTRSSFFILDAMTGALLAEIQTPEHVTSFGLGSLTVGGKRGSEIEDVAFAGDLVGNLFRLNMNALDSAGQAAAPTTWTVDLIFKTYTQGTDCQATPDAGKPCSQPITVAPTLFPSTLNSSGYMVVFGTGRYLNPVDATHALPQAFYGISDHDASTAQPVTQTDLVSQQLTVGSDSVGLRLLSDNAVAAPSRGWKIVLPANSGERVLVSPTPLFNINSAVLATYVPGDDPCKPRPSGSVMLVNAETGGPSSGATIVTSGQGSSGGSTGATVVGQLVTNAPASGSLAIAQLSGGGIVELPGITSPSDGSTISINVPLWRRRAWHTLFDEL